MELIATERHGYRKEGERFTLDGSLAEILLEKGLAYKVGDEPKVQTIKKENNDEKVNDNSVVPHAVRGRGKRSKVA